MCYFSPDIIIIIIGRKITHMACSMHIVKTKGIKCLLRRPEWEEPLGRIK